MENFYPVIAEILDLDPSLANNDFLLENGMWDSLSMVTTIAAIDENYGVILNGNELIKCVTISDVWELVVEGKKNK